MQITGQPVFKNGGINYILYFRKKLYNS